MKRGHTKLIWGAAVVVTIVALAALALRPRALDVDVATVVRAPLRVTVGGDARTRVRSRYVVAAPVSGRVERIEVTAGDSVRAGSVVVRIAPTPLDAAAAAQARARLLSADAALRDADADARTARLNADQAAKTLTRYRAVEGVGGIAPADRERAEIDARAAADALAAALARVEAAREEVRAARAALAVSDRGALAAPTLVRAPAGGRVLRVPEQSERVVTPGTPLLEVGDPCDLEAVVDLLSSDAVRVRPGDLVELAAWGGEEALQGRVRLVEPAAITRVSALGVDEQRVNVVVGVEDAPLTLGDGFRLDARIVVWEGRDLLTVPASAVFRTAHGWSVFVVRAGRSRLVPVRIGHRSDATVELLEGLAPGETVVVFPSDQVRDGVRVRVR